MKNCRNEFRRFEASAGINGGTNSGIDFAEARRAKLSEEYGAEVERMKAEAADRMSDGGKAAGKGRPQGKEIVPDPKPSGQVRDQRAKAAGTNAKYIDAAEIRIRAERRIGELMKAQKDAHGTAQGRRTDLGSTKTQVESPSITLAEAGIDKNLADRARISNRI